MAKALFGAGCFWGVQYYFDQVPGVSNSIVGYSGGHTKNPTYEEVCGHNTGHAEVVLIEFDQELVSYETLIQHFFRIHDPTQLNRQGLDIGDQYRSVVFYFDNEQKNVAQKIKTITQKRYSEPVVTEISKAREFYRAEEYHQKYAEKTGRGQCHVAYAPIE